MSNRGEGGKEEEPLLSTVDEILKKNPIGEITAPMG